MAGKPKTTTNKKQAAAQETSESIAEQVAAFLAAGNKIQEIKRGVSGQSTTRGPKHITISNKASAR